MGPIARRSLGRMILVASSLALAACGRGQSLSSTSASTTPRVLLVVLGGNQSCKPDTNDRNSPLGMDMYLPFKELADSLGSGGSNDVSFFISCHNSDSTVHYVTSDAPDTMFNTDLAQYAGKLDGLITERQPTRVYVAGHSYGGWLAMKTGLALPTDVKIDGLFTIDAISRPNCTILHPSGCTQAPADIGIADRATLAQRTNHWLNFFQTETGFLHSSPIDQADENHQEPAPHTGIDTYPDVWSRITAEISSSMLLN